MKLVHSYYVYILLCADGFYYTGITSNIERRLDEHNMGSDPSCYTFSRRPITLKYTEHFQYVNDAIRREKQIKGWSRKKKQALIDGDYDVLIRLAKRHSINQTE
jgi:putative endonuclease